MKLIAEYNTYDILKEIRAVSLLWENAGINVKLICEKSIQGNFMGAVSGIILNSLTWNLQQVIILGQPTVYAARSLK